VIETWADLRSRSLLFEDESVVVLNKPPGISVTGERHGTDIVQLAKDAGEWLMPAHRIDKVASGTVLFAKSADVHGDITRQFSRRSVDKAYLVVVGASDLLGSGTIDLPLSVGRKSRVRVAAPRESIAFDATSGWYTVPPSAVSTDKSVYPSLTTFVTLSRRERAQLLAVSTVSGRRHQIRVHLAWIGHPILGDPLFDKHAAHRTLLHSWCLEVTATWGDGARRRFEGLPDSSFWSPTDLEPRALDDRAAGQSLEALAALATRARSATTPEQARSVPRSRRGSRR